MVSVKNGIGLKQRKSPAKSSGHAGLVIKLKGAY
jgi:hypothetical protein